MSTWKTPSRRRVRDHHITTTHGHPAGVSGRSRHRLQQFAIPIDKPGVFSKRFRLRQVTRCGLSPDISCSPIQNPSDVTAIALGNPWGLLNSLFVLAIRDGTGRLECPTSPRLPTDGCCENAAVPFVRAKPAPMPLVRNSRHNAASTCCAAIARRLCANSADDVADYTTLCYPLTVQKIVEGERLRLRRH